MIIEQKATPVEVNGGSTHSSFSIAMNGKAFRVLSDTLYQNKIGSIVRELSCNAHDAHVMAGKQDVPFIIHLPDAFNPWFSVQDQGVGLSPENIASVFTVYFQSTKEQSNDTIGAFGLGAKTPFSYTDQFTVTSVKHGLRTIYNAFINEQGIPNIVEMFSEETTEGNGVEIKLSVKREDYSKFASEVKNQLQYFKVKPQLLNSSGDVFTQQATEALFDTSAISVQNYVGYGNGTRVALQGNVGYTLDMNQLSGKISAESYQLLNMLSSQKTILKFNIGEIGVTASREGVEYTATTLKNICNKITEAKKQISDIIEEKMTKEFTTDYQRLAYLNANPIARSFVTTLKVPNAESDSVRWLFNLQKYLIVNNQSSGMVTLVGRYQGRSKASMKHMTYKFIPTTENNQVILFKDKSTLSAKKIQHFFLTNPKVNSVYVVEFFDKVYNKTKQEELQKFLGGFDNFKNMSEIVLPVAVREKQKNTNKIPKYYSYNSLTPYYDVRNYHKEFTDLSDVKEQTVYFTVENLCPTCPSGFISDLQDLSNFIKVLPVIAVRESAVEKLEKNSFFIPLSQYIADKKKELGTEEVKQKINREFIIDAVNSSIHYNLRKKKDLIVKNCPDNEIARLFKTLDKQALNEQHSGGMNLFIGHHPSTISAVRTKAEKAVNVVKNILNKYAVVHTLGSTYHGKEISDQHLIMYLNAVQLYLQK